MNLDPQPQNSPIVPEQPMQEIPATPEQPAPASPQPQPQQEKPKKKGCLIAIIIPALISALLMTLWDFVAEDIFDNIHAQSQQQDLAELNSYFDKTEDYVPGVCTDNSYVSEYLGLEFRTGDNWVMYSEEEKDEAGKGYIDSILSILRGMDAPQEYLNLVEQRVFFNCEMAAEHYDSEGNYQGDVEMFVTNIFGGYEPNAILEKMLNAFSSGRTVVKEPTSSQIQFAGRTADMSFIQIKYPASETLVNISMWGFYEKDVFCLFFSINAGDNDDVFSSFSQQFGEIGTIPVPSESLQQTDGSYEEQELETLKAFFAMSQDYTPGTCTGDSYVSEYLDLEFHADENWEMGDAADLEEALATSRALMTTALENISDSEQINRYCKENAMLSNEMMAIYFSEDGAGQAVVTMLAVNFMPDGLGGDVFAQSIEEEYGVSVKTEQVRFADSTADICTFRYEHDDTGAAADISMWTYYKKGVTALFMCMDLGQSGTALTSFVENMTAVSN